MKKTRREVQISEDDMIILERIKSLERITTDSGALLFCLDQTGRKWYPKVQECIDLKNEIEEHKQTIFELSSFVEDHVKHQNLALRLANEYPTDSDN